MNFTKISSIKPSLTFDDVNLIPSYSEIKSRSEILLSTKFTRRYKIHIPIIASPMSSVCEYDMAAAMADYGGVGIVHRFMPIEQQTDIVSKLLFRSSARTPIAAAIGTKMEDLERAIALMDIGVNVLVIDVAHGHHTSVGKLMNKLTAIRSNENYTEVDIVAGNVATAAGVLYLEEHGADAIRVGIGGGSVCETRIRTGVGVPQLSSVLECAEVASVPIISCGGCRYPGDIAKALAAGADSVILGSMLAGTDESPGTRYTMGKMGERKNFKLHHGSASDVQKTLSNVEIRNIEGTATMIPAKGPLALILTDILDGLRSAFSYVGATDIEEFEQNTQFCRVTVNGVREAHPHLLG